MGARAVGGPIPTQTVGVEVQGATSLDVLTIARDSSDPWVLLEAKPDPTSGITGYTGSGKPGDPFKLRGRISGTYVVRNVFSGTVKSATGSYDWLGLIVAMTPETIRAMELVSPFEISKAQESATVACILNENANDSTKFTSVYVVPEEWVDDLASAVRTVRAMPSLMAADPKYKKHS